MSPGREILTLAWQRVRDARDCETLSDLWDDWTMPDEPI